MHNYPQLTQSQAFEQIVTATSLGLEEGLVALLQPPEKLAYPLRTTEFFLDGLVHLDALNPFAAMRVASYRPPESLECNTQSAVELLLCASSLGLRATPRHLVVMLAQSAAQRVRDLPENSELAEAAGQNFVRFGYTETQNWDDVSKAAVYFFCQNVGGASAMLDKGTSNLSLPLIFNTLMEAGTEEGRAKVAQSIASLLDQDEPNPIIVAESLRAFMTDGQEAERRAQLAEHGLYDRDDLLLSCIELSSLCEGRDNNPAKDLLNRHDYINAATAFHKCAKPYSHLWGRASKMLEAMTPQEGNAQLATMKAQHVTLNAAFSGAMKRNWRTSFGSKPFKI